MWDLAIIDLAPSIFGPSDSLRTGPWKAFEPGWWRLSNHELLLRSLAAQSLGRRPPSAIAVWQPGEELTFATRNALRISPLRDILDGSLDLQRGTRGPKVTSVLGTLP